MVRDVDPTVPTVAPDDIGAVVNQYARVHIAAGSLMVGVLGLMYLRRAEKDYLARVQRQLGMALHLRRVDDRVRISAEELTALAREVDTVAAELRTTARVTLVTTASRPPRPPTSKT